MYFQQSEHNPPRIYAIYGEYIVAINIQTGEFLEGDLPNGSLKLVQEGLQIHRQEVLNI